MIPASLRNFIYHPVRARIGYDVLFGLLVSGIVYGFYQWLGGSIVPDQSLFLVPVVIVLFSHILGLYAWHKMSPVWLKALTLIASGFLAVAFFAYLSLFSLPLVLAVTFTTLGIIMPRAFFNFRTADHVTQLNHVIRDSSPILVVGGGGYIGSGVVERLLREGFRVRVFDKFVYKRDVLADFEKNHHLEIIEGDISDLYRLTMALRDVQAVVHLAGIVGDPAASLDEQLTRHVNIIGTRILKETVKAFRIPKFIFASSCSVYGASEEIVNEESKLNPVSLYAQSKIDSEKELLEDTFDDFHPTILRFATVFGHSRKPRFDLVANLFVAQAHKNSQITVINGDSWRPFVHVADLADAVVRVIKAPTHKVSRQIFNVGDDNNHTTITDLAELVKKVVSVDKPVKLSVVNEVDDRRNYRVSFRKIRETLGFTATHSLEDGVEEIYANMKSGAYDKPYTDPYYSNVEMTKNVQKEFHSDDYQRSHVSAQP